MRYAVSAAVIAVSALVPLNMSGVRVGTDLHDTWPSSTPLIAALKPLVHEGTDNYLVEDYDVAAYYLPKIRATQWHDTVSTSWTDPKTHVVSTGAAGFKAAILAHHYKVIVLDYAQSPTIDEAIRGTIDKAGYRKVTRIVTHSGSGSGAVTIWDLP